MDWNDFFERTRVSAKVESYSKLAPLLGITDGAIGHYRMGRRVPQVWVVADALRIQGHPEPEKQAIEIMKRAALTSPERTFWKRLAATAVAVALGVGFASPRDVQAAVGGFDAAPSIHYAKWCNAPFGVGLAMDQVLPPFPGAQQGRDRSMTTMDPHDRIDMTGPWAG